MHVAVVLNKLFFFNKFSDISYGTCGVKDFKGIFIQKSVNNMYRERGGGGSCPPAPVNKLSYFRV